jgi:hypothetical protein
MSENMKKALIALIAFVGGLLSGLVGAPYAGLVDAGTKVAVEVVEAVPTTPAPVETPAAPEQTEAKDAVVEHVTDDAALAVPAPAAPPATAAPAAK